MPGKSQRRSLSVAIEIALKKITIIKTSNYSSMENNNNSFKNERQPQYLKNLKKISIFKKKRKP
jgi:hypothetical protein